MPIIGRTEEEAKAKYEKAMSYADVIGGLAQVGDLFSIQAWAGFFNIISFRDTLALI
jgi:hypothetical protein